ncbi:NACHT domain-containing protein [Actinokineospora inagensis]|uniref:NACHT domain-containing protein n=1 Tax=Actinokineospora inagensis TaxID=103730 RepID=UPI00047CFF47|nr:hypothetical protein [Actinokineospora inagensis]
MTGARRRPGPGRAPKPVREGEPGASYATALRRWLEVAEVDQRTVARKINVSDTTVSEWLRNSRDWKATPTALTNALKIIDACEGDQADKQRWIQYHNEVVVFQTGYGDELPVPPEPRAAVATPAEVVSDVEARLRSLSDRLAVELDTASGQRHDDSPTRGLSTGLYVRRTQQDDVIGMLAADGHSEPILVHGSAGEGKSSLLWGLYRELADHPVLRPYLLNSPWLTGADGGSPLVSIDELVRVAQGRDRAGRTAVFLIDTVDLLLHDELHRQQVLDLCELVGAAGAEVVLTSRPEEALTLPSRLFRTVGLRPYDDAELPLAVVKHIAAFCPGVVTADPRAKVEEIISAAARGLTVREIVLNPLKLRLLFELYEPYFPSLEHDVSSLYETYWERRVRTDRRAEVGIPVGADLGATAEHAGIALLAAGRTELGHALMLRSTTAVAEAGQGPARRAEVATAIQSLVERGVLVRSARVIRYFHQTMFEYAAAVGLLGRDGERALEFLVRHLEAHPDDLFVGAILEQMLILAVDDPFVAVAAEGVLERMCDGGVPALQRIALGVVAHRPALGGVTERLIDTVDGAALRRYAQALPTVTKPEVTDQVAMLVRVWRRDPGARESVLGSLERLGARDAAVVMAVVRDLDCVTVALNWKGSPARMTKLVARVLVTAADADPTWACAQLLAMVRATAANKAHRSVPLHILDLLADRWSVLGSAAVADEIQQLVVTLQERHDANARDTRQALGRIRGKVWQGLLARDGAGPWWETTIDYLCATLEDDYYSVGANADLHAIADLIDRAVLSADTAVRTVNRLTEMPGFGTFALGGLFTRVLDSPAREAAHPATATVSVIVDLLGGLPAPGNRPATREQRLAHVARKALRDARLSPEVVAELMTAVPAAAEQAAWLADDYLAVLLVPAAVGGHEVARRALAATAEGHGALSPTGLKNISYDLTHYADTWPDAVALLVALSIRRMSATPLSAVAESPSDRVLGALVGQSSQLTRLVDRLFTVKAAQRDAASLWRNLYRAGAVPAPGHEQLLLRFLECSQQAARGNILELAVDVALDLPARQHQVERTLRDLFEVDRTTRSVVPVHRGSSSHVAGIARGAWLRLASVGTSAVDVEPAELVAIASAAPTSADILVVLGRKVIGLARSGQAERAADLLLRVAAAATDIGLSGKQKQTAANNLRSAMRATLRSTSLEARRALLARTPDLPPAFARILVAAAAQEDFPELRPALADLLGRDVPAEVKQQIHDDIRIRSRSAAKGALPRLLLPLASTCGPQA